MDKLSRQYDPSYVNPVQFFLFCSVLVIVTICMYEGFHASAAEASPATACPPNAGGYGVALISPSGSSVCGLFDTYSFTITNGFIQIRTHFVEGEAVNGTANGKNAVFHITSVPAPSTSLKLYRNGLRLRPGKDYVLSGNAVTFFPIAVPQTGDDLVADYRR